MVAKADIYFCLPKFKFKFKICNEDGCKGRYLLVYGQNSSMQPHAELCGVQPRIYIKCGGRKKEEKIYINM